jgi:hypothetical protein
MIALLDNALHDAKKGTRILRRQAIEWLNSQEMHAFSCAHILETLNMQRSTLEKLLEG